MKGFGNLVMLHLLRRGDEGRVEHRCNGDAIAEDETEAEEEISEQA